MPRHARRGMNGAPIVQALASGEFPILTPPLRLSEFVATLPLAQDKAFGQPLESQLRSCLLAAWIAEAAGCDKAVRDTVWWVAPSCRVAPVHPH